jgi:FixJ family two-component response regulator
VILDLRLPGPSGLDVQEILMHAADPLPVVFLTGHGEVPDSVRAMKGGAVDFLTKTVDGASLLDAVGRALARDGNDRSRRARQRAMRVRYEQLSPREREVFAHLITGQLNKQVGFDLGISEHTIKIHRGRVLQKMQANSIADLVRMAAELGIEPVGSG